MIFKPFFFEATLTDHHAGKDDYLNIRRHGETNESQTKILKWLTSTHRPASLFHSLHGGKKGLDYNTFDGITRTAQIIYFGEFFYIEFYSFGQRARTLVHLQFSSYLF